MLVTECNWIEAQATMIECVKSAGGEVSLRDILDLSEDAGADREICRVVVWHLIDNNVFNLTNDLRLVLSCG